MPPDRSTAATCGHTSAISGVSKPVPEAISTARPGRNGPPRARASASTGRRYPPRDTSQSRAAASNPARMPAASCRSQVPGAGQAAGTLLALGCFLPDSWLARRRRHHPGQLLDHPVIMPGCGPCLPARPHKPQTRHPRRKDPVRSRSIIDNL